MVQTFLRFGTLTRPFDLICLNVYEFDKTFNYTVILHLKMLQHVCLEIISLDA